MPVAFGQAIAPTRGPASDPRKTEPVADNKVHSHSLQVQRSLLLKPLRRQGARRVTQVQRKTSNAQEDDGNSGREGREHLQDGSLRCQRSCNREAALASCSGESFERSLTKIHVLV